MTIRGERGNLEGTLEAIIKLPASKSNSGCCICNLRHLHLVLYLKFLAL